MTVSAREVDDAFEAVKQAKAVLDARFETLMEVVARLPVLREAPKFECPVPTCRVPKPSEAALADHLANVHGVESGDLDRAWSVSRSASD